MIIKKLINLFINKNKLCSTPNQHAPKPSMEIINQNIHVNGYQQYIINKDNIKPSKASYDLDKKTNLLKKYYQSDFMLDKTFLDLGAASGYFTFMAIINKCKHATAIDIDNTHLQIIKNIYTKYNIENITVISDNIDSYNGKADIVNALSIIHWIFSCTSILGNMKNMILFLKKMTGEVLFIEWVDPSDEAIKYFKHLDYNNINKEHKDTYNYENFILELNNNFTSVEMIGKTRSTRKIFKATI